MLSRPMNKKGLSIMIGYVLLVAIAVVIGVIVYAWLRTYIPTEIPSCPDGTSLFLKVTCEEENLSVKLDNNGRFDVSGYYIRGSNLSGEEVVATIDLGEYDYNNLYEGLGGVVLFKIGDTSNPGDTSGLKPGEDWTDVFNLSSQEVNFIEIVPARYQERKGKIVLVVCSKAIAREDIVCGGQ